MILMAVYVVFLVVGELLAYALGLLVDRAWPVASLPAFLALFFSMFWLCWILAVRATARWDEPRGT